MSILVCVLGRLPELMEGGEKGGRSNSQRDKLGVEETWEKETRQQAGEGRGRV